MTTYKGEYDPAKRTEKDKARAKAYYKEYMPLRQKVNRQYLENVRSSSSCVDCGESDPIVLQFHHRDGKEKYSIGVYTRWSMDRLKEEIGKCDVLCANCHIKRHHKEKSGYFAQKSENNGNV